MSYVLLMMEDPAQRETRTETEGHEVYGRMLKFGEDLKARGKLVMSQSLQMTQSKACRAFFYVQQAPTFRNLLSLSFFLVLMSWYVFIRYTVLIEYV